MTKFLNGSACARDIECDDQKLLTCNPTLLICACAAGYYWSSTTTGPGQSSAGYCGTKQFQNLILTLCNKNINIFKSIYKLVAKSAICTSTCTTGNNYQCQDMYGVQCLSGQCS